MSDRVQLRPWQREAFDKFAASEQADFLAVATPGAGKTTFALACARWALGNQRRRLVIVAPTTHLKTQWAIAAHRMGLHVDHNWSPGDAVAKDVHGIVTTYQQVSTADTAKKLRGIANDAFVVLDEVDAALDEANVTRFGDAIRELSERTQVIVITHNRGTVEVADSLWGVTVGEDAASRVFGLRLDEAKRIADQARAEREAAR